MSKVIVFASPLFFLLIGIEYWWSRRPGSQAVLARAVPGASPVGYRLNDTLGNLSLGMISQLWGVLTRVVQIGVYAVVYQAVALFPHEAFWSSWYGVLLALVFYDYCYYWLHRGGHEIALLWAAHVVHHQSQTFNLATALRQPSSYFLLGWIFYLPMAVVGVSPLVFGIVALIDLLYQFWVHTEYVGKLGWFDRWFCSPSNHRVHHAVNDGYLDKNYGGILIIWDRMFGSYCEETQPCIYGTRSQLNSWDPLWANAEVYAGLARTSQQASCWADKLRVWFKPPGWQPASLVLAAPRPAFDLAQVRTFDPPMGPGLMLFSGLQFVGLLAAVVYFLWHAESWPLGQAALWVVAITVGMWALCAAIQGRLRPLMALTIQCAMAATLTGALGPLLLHFAVKPLTMLLAIAFVMTAMPASKARGLLVMALVFCGLGDGLLMLPGPAFFIPGLAAFLLAHLFYIALLRQDTSSLPWFPNRRALLTALLAAAGMYAVVWPGLPDPVLKVAVAAYALVIALMAAQALGRASAWGTPAARIVAAGACLFMLSDSLIAINRFVQPLDLSAWWILSTYYLAQILIVGQVLPTRPAHGG